MRILPAIDPSPVLKLAWSAVNRPWPGYTNMGIFSTTDLTNWTRRATVPWNVNSWTFTNSNPHESFRIGWVPNGQ